MNGKCFAERVVSQALCTISLKSHYCAPPCCVWLALMLSLVLHSSAQSDWTDGSEPSSLPPSPLLPSHYAQSPCSESCSFLLYPELEVLSPTSVSNPTPPLRSSSTSWRKVSKVLSGYMTSMWYIHPEYFPICTTEVHLSWLQAPYNDLWYTLSRQWLPHSAKMCEFRVDTGMNRSEVGTGRKESRSFVIIMKEARSPAGDRLFWKPYR